MLNLGFRWILSATIWGTMTGLLIWALKILFSRRLSAGAMFWMWMIFLLKLTVPVGPQSAFSLFNFLPARRLNQPGIIVRMEGIVPPTEAVRTATESGHDLFRAAAVVWLAVALCLGVWFLLSSLILKHRLSQSEICTQARMNRLLEDAKQRLDIKRSIQLLVQPYIATPSLYGIFRPRILLPLNMDGFSDEEMTYVFLHELSHYKRRDMILNCLLILLQLLHWFNPFNWFFFRKIREDMELATDEAAMKQIAASNYHSYGRTLLMAVERFSICRISGSIMSMAHTKSNLKRRLKRICRFRRPTFAGTLFAVVLVFVLGLTCLTDAKQIPLLSIPQAGTSAASAELSDYLNRQQNPEVLITDHSGTAAEAETHDTNSTNSMPEGKPEPEEQPVITPDTSSATSYDTPQAAQPTDEPLTQPTIRKPQAPVQTTSPTEAPAPPVSAQASAHRTLLTPGTNFSDMLTQLSGNGSLNESLSYEAGKSRLSAQSDTNGVIHLYLSADTIDAVDIEIFGPEGTEAVSLSIVPRTYYAYIISGLNPESVYRLDLESQSAGRLLIY